MGNDGEERVKLALSTQAGRDKGRNRGSYRCPTYGSTGIFPNLSHLSHFAPLRDAVKQADPDLLGWRCRCMKVWVVPPSSFLRSILVSPNDHEGERGERSRGGWAVGTRASTSGLQLGSRQWWFSSSHEPSQLSARCQEGHGHASGRERRLDAEGGQSHPRPVRWWSVLVRFPDRLVSSGPSAPRNQRLRVTQPKIKRGSTMRLTAVAMSAVKNRRLMAEG